MAKFKNLLNNLKLDLSAKNKLQNNYYFCLYLRIYYPVIGSNLLHDFTCVMGESTGSMLNECYLKSVTESTLKFKSLNNQNTAKIINELLSLKESKSNKPKINKPKSKKTKNKKGVLQPVVMSNNEYQKTEPYMKNKPSILRTVSNNGEVTTVSRYQLYKENWG